MRVRLVEKNTALQRPFIDKMSIRTYAIQRLCEQRVNKRCVAFQHVVFLVRRRPVALYAIREYFAAVRLYWENKHT